MTTQISAHVLHEPKGSFENPSGQAVAEVDMRGSVKLDGQLVVGDGTLRNSVTLPLFSDNEVWRYVVTGIRDDGFACIGVFRPGVNIAHAVSTGTFGMASTTAFVSTLEQLRTDEDPQDTDFSTCVREGSHSQHVQVHTGTGGSSGVIALLDTSGEMCGVVTGECFDSGSWEKRILPGEDRMNIATLREAADDSYLIESAPIEVQDAAGNSLGWLQEHDFTETLTLYVSNKPRPQASVTGAVTGVDVS